MQGGVAHVFSPSFRRLRLKDVEFWALFLSIYQCEYHNDLFLDNTSLCNPGWPGTCALTSTSSAGSGVIHLFKLTPTFVSALIQIHHAAKSKGRDSPLRNHTKTKDKHWLCRITSDTSGILGWWWSFRSLFSLLVASRKMSSLSRDDVTVLLRVTSYCRGSCNRLSQSPWVQAFIAVSLLSILYFTAWCGINICVV